MSNVIIQKQYARRDITGYRSPYDDPFEYSSILDFEMEEICRLMIPLLDIKSSPDPLAQARIELEQFTQHAGPAYSPEYWYVASLGREIIGIVFPQRYWDKMEEGSIFHIGVLPEHQGKDYGKILHAKGLATLAEMGCIRYVGSTDIGNTPMIRIFERNGCKLSAIRAIEVDETGQHVRFVQD